MPIILLSHFIFQLKNNNKIGKIKKKQKQKKLKNQKKRKIYFILFFLKKDVFLGGG
jgi:hypothetical protein